jgi:threonine/homoserine/homoserine lactone efflux protein
VPDLPGFLSFLLAAPVLELTPGPNMAWLALPSATAGRDAGLAAAAGITLGLATQAVLAPPGVAAVLAAWPGLSSALHLAGVAFPVWLAWESWRESRNPAQHLPAAAGPGDALALSALYLLVATAVHVRIVAAAGGLSGWLADPAVSVRMHRVQATALVVLASRLLWRG